MMKRIIALLLVLLLCLGTLAGCGKEEAADGGGTQQEQTEDPGEDKEEDPEAKGDAVEPGTDEGEKDEAENTEGFGEDMGNAPLITSLPGKEKVFRLRYESIYSDFDPEYMPYFELYEDGSFLMVENTYAGMGSYIGTYREEDGTYLCDVEPNFSGYAGDDVKGIVFETVQPGVLKLMTDLCASREGTVFEQAQ